MIQELIQETWISIFNSKNSNEAATLFTNNIDQRDTKEKSKPWITAIAIQGLV